MKTNPKARYDINILASEFEKIKQKEGESVNFDGFRFADFISILESGYEFEKEIPKCEKQNVLRRALFSCGNKGEINQSNLIKEIKLSEKKFLNLPERKYKLVTSISIKYSPLLKPKRVLNNYIQFLSWLPKYYDQSAIKKKISNDDHIIPPGYTIVVISTIGRTKLEAVENGLDSFEIIRGIWNFINNSITVRSIQSGKHKPINKILLGPIHTLHNSDGSLATDDYWYEILHTEANMLEDINKNIANILHQEKNIRSLLRRISYRKELTKLFLRYNDTFDVVDYSYALTSLWGILELLTDTVDKSYDQTISRAIFLYDDYTIVKQYLESIRDVRNKVVHSLQRDTRSNLMLYQLKTIVEKLFLFHIRNPYHFKSLTEFGLFLDLPKETSALQTKYRIIKSGMKFKRLIN